MNIDEEVFKNSQGPEHVSSSRNSYIQNTGCHLKCGHLTSNQMYKQTKDSPACSRTEEFCGKTCSHAPSIQYPFRGCSENDGSVLPLLATNNLVKIPIDKNSDTKNGLIHIYQINTIPPPITFHLDVLKKHEEEEEEEEEESNPDLPSCSYKLRKKIRKKLVNRKKLETVDFENLQTFDRMEIGILEPAGVVQRDLFNNQMLEDKQKNCSINIKTRTVNNAQLLMGSPLPTASQLHIMAWHRRETNDTGPLTDLRHLEYPRNWNIEPPFVPPYNKKLGFNSHESPVFDFPKLEKAYTDLKEAGMDETFGPRVSLGYPIMKERQMEEIKTRFTHLVDENHICYLRGIRRRHVDENEPPPRFEEDEAEYEMSEQRQVRRFHLFPSSQVTDILFFFLSQYMFTILLCLSHAHMHFSPPLHPPSS